MKKFVLIVFCLLMLVNTANAAIDGVTFSPSPPVAGQPFSVTVQVSGSDGNHVNADISISSDPEMSNTIDHANIGLSHGTGIIKGLTVPNDGKKYYIRITELRGQDIIDMQDQLITQAPANSNVPEFPSVALPVAAIIVLIFVIGRKKKAME
jgi:hypothetical protein